MSWTALGLSAPSRLFPTGRVHDGAVLILTGGTSDILPTSVSGGENDTAEQAFLDMVVYAESAREAGFSKIVASTITPGTIPGWFDTDAEAQRVIMNNYIRSANNWEAVADIAADSRLTNPANTTYYSDGIHFTAAGAQAAAEVVLAALQRIL